ncbi:hypothetical protein Tco_1163697 [Tanacetum coccineum]
MPKRSTSSFYRFVLASLVVFFSPLAGKAVACPAKGTSLVVASDAFSTIVENQFKLEALLEVPIECSLVQQARISLISLDNLVNFEGSSFSSVSRQLAKLCEAKCLESLDFREVTRRVVSWLTSGYKGISFSSSYGESGVKKEDLVSFKRSDKSYIFIVFEIALALDSLSVPKSVWAVFNLFPADLV